MDHIKGVRIWIFLVPLPLGGANVLMNHSVVRNESLSMSLDAWLRPPCKIWWFWELGKWDKTNRKNKKILLPWEAAKQTLEWKIKLSLNKLLSGKACHTPIFDLYTLPRGRYDHVCFWSLQETTLSRFEKYLWNNFFSPVLACVESLSRSYHWGSVPNKSVPVCQQCVSYCICRNQQGKLALTW